LIRYFIRRILLIVPTFIGITFITFLILQFVPGGPLEREMIKLQMGGVISGSESGAVSSNRTGMTNIPESALKEIREFYGFDRPIPERYLEWVLNLCRFNFGKSYVYSEPVIDVITSRFSVSVYFGLIGFVLTYLICVPLGVAKAARSGSKFDLISSIIVFLGYSTPGWAFGALMLIFLGGGSFLNVFPLGGFRSEDFDNMNFLGQIYDQLRHTILPVISYLLGSFATLTILTKNSVIENLNQDYIRTAYAKGLSEKRVIYVHALRNSLIPIVTGLGHFLGILLAGSILIEKVFNIPGIGLLAYDSIINRDYPVIMGLLVFQSIILLTGNILTDFLYAAVDPRIKYK
jgi:microcin C transport system permease protein